MEKKLRKLYLTYYNLLIAQDLWQAYYQILSIIFMKEFISNTNMNAIIKKCETCGIKYKYCDCFLEYTNFKDDLIKYKCLCCNKKLSTKVWWKTIFSTDFLFCSYKKVFIPMNIWMIGENSIKHHYLKKKIFTVLKYGRYY